MYKQLICASLLVVFIGFQLANSLKCYTCTTPSNCKNPQVVTCTNAAANATRLALLPIIPSLPNVTSSSYECVNVTKSLTSSNNPSQAAAGCAYRNAETCNHVFSGTYSYCKSCNSDLCTRNPAGTFSSSLLTIVTSIVGVVFTKMFATAW